MTKPGWVDDTDPRAAALEVLGVAPAPPTPAADLDVASLRAAVDAMTPGPWASREHVEVCGDPDTIEAATGRAPSDDTIEWYEIDALDRTGLVQCATIEYDDQRSVDKANAVGIVALRNAAPALLDEVERLRLDAAKIEANVRFIAGAANEQSAEIARLRADLVAERKRGEGLARIAEEAVDFVEAVFTGLSEIESVRLGKTMLDVSDFPETAERWRAALAIPPTTDGDA